MLVNYLNFYCLQAKIKGLEVLWLPWTEVRSKAQIRREQGYFEIYSTCLLMWNSNAMNTEWF